MVNRAWGDRRDRFGRLTGAVLAAAVAMLPLGCAGGQSADSAAMAAGTDGEGAYTGPASGLGSYLAARHAEAQGDSAAAAVFYLHALQSDPDNVNLLRRAYFFAAVEGDVSDAATLAARLMLLDSEASIAPLVVATELVQQGQSAEAATLLARQPTDGLNGFLVPVLLAWAREGAGNLPGAYAALDGLDVNPAYRTLKALHKGLLADAAGDTAAASAAFKDYLDGNATPSLRGLQLVGGYWMRQGDVARAREMAEAYRDRYPDSLLMESSTIGFDTDTPPVPDITGPAEGMAELYYGAGSLLADNDQQTAAMFVRLALHLRPRFPQAQLLLGQLLASQGRQSEAVAVFQAVAEEAPKDTGLSLAAGLSQAESLSAAEDVEGALSVYARLADVYPNRADPLAEKANLLRSNERFAEAADAYDAAIKRLGTPDARHWALFFGRGVAFERTDRWDRAEADFQTALELSPDQPFVLNYLGYSWVDKGLNITQAKALIERAVEQRPKDGFMIDSLGWAHYRLGDYAEAVRHLERAVNETPDDPTINDHLGDAYWMVGRKREARFQWERALDLADDQMLIGQITDKLKNGLTPPAPVAGPPAASNTTE